MINALLTLQRDIFSYQNKQNNGKYPYSLNYYSNRVLFSPVGDLFAIYYYGAGYDDDPSIKATDLTEDYNFSFCALLDLLSEQKYADKVVSLIFDSPDEGANGINDWNFTRLINTDVNFPNLEEFKVKLTELGDHNASLINYDDEDSVITKLVTKMPSLVHLVIPSTPDDTFFSIVHRSLQTMVVQASWGSQNFLGCLAKSQHFPALYSLDYAEPLNTFGDLAQDNYTSVETYKQLFTSPLFSQHPHFHFKLRNSILTRQQLFEIQAINPKVQFLYIESQAGKYVNHMIKKESKN